MLRVVRSQPSAMLFAAQLLGVLIYPFAEGGHGGRALVSVFGILVLWLAVRAVRASPALTGVGLVLAVPASVMLLVEAASGDDTLLPYSSGLEAILYFYAAGALIAYMLADHRVSRDELFAVGATFTLVAWAFAYTFTVCQAIAPGSFTAAVDPHADRSWVELLFMSFTALTSVGLGDVVPIRPFARALVMLEELGGVAYLGMLVSRIIGLTVMTRTASAGSRAPAPGRDA